MINVDNTPNKAGQITEYVQAYVEIEFYKMTQHLFVTNLGNVRVTGAQDSRRILRD